MGTDSNYPEDNNTTITCEWNLLTDRTALDAAIAQAEAVDISGYTEESVKAVTDALEAAKALSLTATQEEMDAAAKAIEEAIAGLQVPVNRTELDKAVENAEKMDLTNRIRRKPQKR